MWNRMSQGLSNSPVIYSKLMAKLVSNEMNIKLQQKYGKQIWPDSCLKQVFDETVSHFIDDICIYSVDLMTYKDDAFRVLDALKEADLKISGGKCLWGVTKFIILGVTRDTNTNCIYMKEKKAQALLALKKPASLSCVQIRLAIFNYFWEKNLSDGESLLIL